MEKIYITNLDLKHKIIISEEWSREEWCGPYLNNWEYAVTWHLPKKTSWSGYRLGGNHFTQRLRLLMLLGIHCGENRFPKCHSSSFLIIKTKLEKNHLHLAKNITKNIVQLAEKRISPNIKAVCRDGWSTFVEKWNNTAKLWLFCVRRDHRFDRRSDQHT